MRLLVKISIGLIFGLLLVALVLHVSAKNEREAEQTALSSIKKSVILLSDSFPPNGDMPIRCSCKGKEVSPALIWEDVHPDVKSFVVLAQDYDVPTPAFPLYNLSHWVVFNLPATVRSLPEGVTAQQLRLLGGKVGRNGTGDPTYIGPCPPIGRHAYVFRVYALDQMLLFPDLPNKQAVLDAMKDHVLGYG
ncbi:MAG: hypothetical protein JWP57_3844, partial [Spirosoma sp.]|nr:hypothetical protein [Spirosoma sp.]